MNAIIIIGLLCVFISTFFAFYIYDILLKENIFCILGVHEHCNYGRSGVAFTVGLVFVMLFILIDMAVAQTLRNAILMDHDSA